ncbi:hypothetical protein [Phaeocystidibacter luteus]|nr:hypothetical protein [Phaeocystidibacter luteus]
MITALIFGIHGIVWGGAFLILIYLIIRRVKEKEEETFEDRDN